MLALQVHRVHWEKNRFIYDLMYKQKVMQRELYDYLVREKIADGALISKWRKQGYENLCSLLAIQRKGHNFGTTSHCRVPIRSRAPAQQMTPYVQTGCISCASCDGKAGNPIWWNTPLDDDDHERFGAKKRSCRFFGTTLRPVRVKRVYPPLSAVRQ